MTKTWRRQNRGATAPLSVRISKEVKDRFQAKCGHNMTEAVERAIITYMGSYDIIVDEVRDYCGICEVIYRSNLQPQTLKRLIPRDYDPEETHKALQDAADRFYGGAA